MEPNEELKIELVNKLRAIGFNASALFELDEGVVRRRFDSDTLEDVIKEINKNFNSAIIYEVSGINMPNGMNLVVRAIYED